MSNERYIFDAIDELNRINGMPEDGFFLSIKDRAYRLEAIRQMFCGLERENQDKVLRYAMECLLNQVPGTAEKAALIEGVVA